MSSQDFQEESLANISEEEGESPSRSYSYSLTSPPEGEACSSSSSSSSSFSPPILVDGQQMEQPSFGGEESMSAPSLHSYSNFPLNPPPQEEQEEPIDIRDNKKSPFLHGKFGTEAWNATSPDITPIDKNEGTLQETQIQLLKLLLLDPKFTLISLLDDVLPSYEAPTTSRMLLALMHANSYVVPVMDAMVQKEVISPSLLAPQQLFKADSLRANMVTTFVSIMGAGYLHLLDDLVTEIITKAEDLELDPRRNEDVTEVQRNQNKVLDYGTQLIDQLLSGISECPPELRHVTQLLSLEVMGRFPDWPDGGYRAVAMLLFTRFVCIALVRPEDFTLYKPSLGVPGLTTSWSSPAVKPRVRRTLAFLSKLIHNTVINQKAKEPYLRFMDSFVQEYSPQVLDLCKKLATPEEGYELPSLVDQMKINNSALRQLVSVYSENFEKIDQKQIAPQPMMGELDQLLKELKEADRTSMAEEEGKKGSSKATKIIGQKKSAAAASGVGAVVGGAVGTALFPGVGTVVGAAVGGAFGGAGVYQFGHNQKAKREREVFQTEMASIWDNFQHHNACFRCDSTFSYTNRKHHCRACGHVICNSCSRKRTYLQGIEWPVRVCDSCFMLFPAPVSTQK